MAPVASSDPVPQARAQRCSRQAQLRVGNACLRHALSRCRAGTRFCSPRYPPLLAQDMAQCRCQIDTSH